MRIPTNTPSSSVYASDVVLDDSAATRAARAVPSGDSAPQGPSPEPTVRPTPLRLSTFRLALGWGLLWLGWRALAEWRA